MDKELFTSEEAAKFLGVSPHTIRNWKTKTISRSKYDMPKPIGPKWIVVGERAIRYRKSDLEAYATEKNLHLR